MFLISLKRRELVVRFNPNNGSEVYIEMQIAFQKWSDNAINKTINMPASLPPQDIKDSYFLAWKLGPDL